MTSNIAFETDVLSLLKDYRLKTGYFYNGTLFYDSEEECLDDIAFIEELKEKFGDIIIGECRGEIAIDFA